MPQDRSSGRPNMMEDNVPDIIVTGEDDGRDALAQVAECDHSGIVNPKESEAHHQRLTNALDKFRHQIKDREIKGSDAKTS